MVLRCFIPCKVFNFSFRGLCVTSASLAKKTKMKKVLNVAEKNDAAKNIAFFLSNGHSTRREGFSKFNKLYEFECEVNGTRRQMVMTSVSGHLLNHQFVGMYKSWTSCSPEALFDAQVVKFCPENFTPIKRTLEKEIKSCDTLIIWTDCDREGENIGYEIIDTCTAVKPNLQIYRAKFSEITAQSIRRAIQNLGRPNKAVSDAVEVRSELDLRIGAAFTRFQTLRLKRVFPTLAEYLLSYGSCQFPTLGFVVERYLERERFVAETFWKIKVTHTIDNLTVEFRWQRDRLFDESVCLALLARCQENPIATVEKVEGKPKSKWRPTPLDTTEMEKIASRKLKLSAKETLKIAEKLYTQGFISYPRTETNIFPSSINLASLVELQVQDSNWGNFASRVLEDGPNPRQGKKSDESHPPIHPTKYTNSLQGNEARVYEFIVRHFLACVSKDAKGHETTVTAKISEETFLASGLMILEKNYLEVYPYENWNAKAIHLYQQGQSFQPTVLDVVSGETSPPNLLTEADLISLMEKHGIGTDATHAEHIETIKSRAYVGLPDNIHFVPSAIGMGLVEGYNSMGFEMSKPRYRAELEAGLKMVCDGIKNPQELLREQVNKYRILFQKAKAQVIKIDQAIGKYIEENARQLTDEEDPMSVTAPIYEKVVECGQCGLDLVLRRKDNKIFLSCVGFPNCRSAIWFPNKVVDAKTSAQTCLTCGPSVKQIEFKFSPGSMAPYYPNEYTGCINGCDENFNTMLGIRAPSANSNNTAQGQGGRRRSEEGARASNQPWQPPPPPPGGGAVVANERPGNNNSAFSISSSQQGSNNSWNQSNRANNNDGDIARRNQKRPRQDSDNQGEHMCFCNLPAKQLTVRRDGPNSGREFLVCSKDSDDKCSFYAWLDEITDMKCFCNSAAKKFTVKKEGPNKGKEFYSCGKPQGEQKCGFFLWVGEEEGNQQNPNQQQRNNRVGQQPQTQSRFRGRGENRGGGQRKCGICHQPGHTRRNCPQNQD